MLNNLFLQKISRKLTSFLVMAGVVALAGCGSGGGGATGTTGGAAVQTLTGTVAVGAPLVGATVTVKDSTGATVSTTTAAGGTFSVAVTGKTPPLMVQAAHASLGAVNMYSIVPAAITSTANINVTPITTLVMYELNQGVDPGTMFRNTTFNALTSQTTGTAETTVRNNLAAKLTGTAATALAGVSSGFSMMTGSFTANGIDAYDKALDNIGKVVQYPAAGGVTLQTSAVAPVTTNYAATTPVVTTPTAASLQIMVNSTQMPSSGSTPVTLTATVLDTTGTTMVGRTVTFSVGSDSSAYINNISGVSDANGLVTAKLNLGSNKTNRTITVTATVDGKTATTPVSVTGTTISISGNSSLAFGATTALTLSLKDSAGTPLAGVPVTLTSQNGNSIALVTSSTSVAGLVTANVTASKTGNDVLTASAAGASTSNTLTISPDSFAFTAPTAIAPATVAEIPLGTVMPVSVNWTTAGLPVADGSQISFSSSRGTITSSSTTISGVASATISANTAGRAIITASGTGGTPAATMSVDFVATSASTITAQAIPSTIQVSTATATQANNTSLISVVVRDAANNLVKNAKVNFSIVSDPSGGALSAATATTDSGGAASVNYTAGTTSSPQNGVSISATVVDVRGVAPIAAIANTINLTVSGQSLFVRLGTDNKVGTVGQLNSKTYVAIVTDAGGNPLANTQVRFVLRPYSFEKGIYIKGATSWVKADTVAAAAATATTPAVNATFAPTVCPNEDLNFNGIVDTNVAIAPGITIATEDTNGNGKLDPGGVASVNPTAITDANGFAYATVNYPKDHANWTAVTLEARTGVVGNDPPATATFMLPGLAADYNDLTVSPPGQTSPFGAGQTALTTVCTNPY